MIIVICHTVHTEHTKIIMSSVLPGEISVVTHEERPKLLGSDVQFQ